jgi:paraquat-inducible protein B
VLLELELTAVPFGEMTPDTIQRDLPKEVRHGLRSRLTAQGVTGTSYLEIDYLDPARYPALPIEWEPNNPYLPSAPSAFAQIVSSAEEVFAELERINFTKIATGVEQLIDSLDRKVGDLPLARLGTNAISLLAEVRDSNQHLQSLLDRPEIGAVLKDLAAAVAGLRRAAESPALTNSVARLERTMGRLDGLLAGKDEALEASLENLRSLTENLRELSENAKRFPAQLLWGEPPKPTRAP